MQDIDNVGKTGRHTMAFEMGGHHAFNAEEGAGYAYEGEVYWKDDCVAYCMDLLADVGADLEDVTLIEDPWVGGGNAGPAFEVIYRGLELATLVFMQFEADPDGDYEMKDGNTYSRMDRRIIDTGYGLERWTWMSRGTATIYEAIYPEMIEFLRANAGLAYTEEEEAIVHRAATLAGHLDIDEVEDLEAARETIADEVGVPTERLRELGEPLERIYAIADHSRTLAYMLGDEIVPSNVGTGYLARMVLRRTKRLVEDVGVDAPLDELVDMQAERLGYTNRDTIRDVVRTEVEKYRETLDRGTRKVRQLAEEYAGREDAIPVEELIELYDSHGIQPDMVEDIAAEHGVDVQVPDDFYALVAGRHGGGQAFEEAGEAPYEDRIADLPATDRLYYEDQERMEFEAVVLESFERPDGDYDVVLDQTMFYPEGGGQPPDHGTLATDDVTADLTDVQTHDDVIVHTVDADPGKGEFVRGQVDADRRRRLMVHHTATHVIGHAARQVLGDHVRQAGAQKHTDSARIDLRHYEAVSREQEKEIERIANRIVRANHQVIQEWPHRHEAESEYGFDLYQGGIPAGTNIRLIHVAEDVQACGGTHVTRTGDIGTITVLSTERVQDGVVRFSYAAGEAAIEAIRATEDTLLETADVLDVDPTDVPETAERFFEEWKARGKEIEGLKADLAHARAAGTEGEEVPIGEATAVIQRIDADMEELRAQANELAAQGKIAVLGSGADGAQFVVAAPENSGVNAGEVVGELAGRVGGGGGGPPDFAQGGGPDGDALEEALADAPDVLRRVANA
jgi:alanyl-tRNA synthetase